MLIELELNLYGTDLSHFLITKDRFFVVSSYTGYDDVPVVKTIGDDFFETTERQCVETSDYIIAISDKLERAIAYRDTKRKLYNDHLKEFDKNEVYGSLRYNVLVYNESSEMFEII